MSHADERMKEFIIDHLLKMAHNVECTVFVYAELRTKVGIAESEAHTISICAANSIRNLARDIAAGTVVLR